MKNVYICFEYAINCLKTSKRHDLWLQCILLVTILNRCHAKQGISWKTFVKFIYSSKQNPSHKNPVSKFWLYQQTPDEQNLFKLECYHNP